jgi:translation initiation factor 4G
MAPNSFVPGAHHAPNLRRESSQSSHGDMSNHGVPGGPGRGGYPMQAGRGGRGGFQGQQYSQQMSYSPQQNFRGQPNQRGMSHMPSYQGRSQPFPNSPNMAVRSPAMMNANPATTPQMPHMQMVPGIPGQQYAYQGHQGYPQVNRHVSSSNPPPTRGKAGKGKGRGRGASNFNNSKREWDRPAARNDPQPQLLDPALMLPPQQIPFDLSPASGNFEKVLTGKKQGYHVQLQTDPSLQAMFQQQQWMQQNQPQMQGYPPPASPRSNYVQGPGPQFMQPQYSNQGPHPQQAQAMSRDSSQVSASERPTSSLGQPPTPAMTAVSGHPHPASRATSSPIPKTEFIVPPKKSAAIVIKNEEGVVQPVTKPSLVAPVRATPPPVKPATPPVHDPRGRSVSTVDSSHARTDSANEKSGEEKRRAMQDAVAKKIAEDAKHKQDKEDAEKKALMEKEEAESKEKEAALHVQESETKPEAPAPVVEETKATEVPDRSVPEIVEPSAVEDQTEETPASVKNDEPEEEDEFEKLARQMEEEEAAREEEEKKKEAAYQAKKQAEREAQKQKEAEEEAAYYATMKQAEREAEEAEEARERKLAGTPDTEDHNKALDVVKAEDAPASPSVESPAVQTPVASGAVTPVSDASMPPPAKGASASRRERPAALTLETSKQVEPPQPSAAMKALQSARFLEDVGSIRYPTAVASPNPALNKSAPADRKFKYNKEFLLQFQNVFKEKPSLDWDARIRDTIGDGSESSARPGSARTPSNMGARSTSNRPSVMQGFGVMGTFNAPPRAGPANLPPGTTSAERFALSNQGGMGGQRAGPMPSNPFAFGRPAGVPLVGPSMSRNSSSNALAGQNPSSPRVGGSQRGNPRVGSKRDRVPPKRMEEENKNMPLTASMDLKPIQTSSSGWKPRSIGQTGGAGPAPDGHMPPDVVQRKVKGLLNKMTPEKFERIADQILEIAAQSKNESDGRTLRQVIQLTFEKATDEAHWASTYALFCERMLKFMSPDIKDENIKDKHGNVVTGGALFRKYLLNRCQEEFERGWKVNMPPKPEGQTEEAALLSEEYYIAAAAKRRGLGLVKFIGELYKLTMLTERIMHECIKKLLELDENGPDESEVESLVSLLNTVGLNLEQSERGPAMMNVYFERIVSIMNHPDLPSRLRFKLLDVIDLRKHGWQSKNDDKGPKTLAEIHADAQRKQHEAELERLRQQASNRGGGGRLPMGRGDARNFSGGRGMPPPDYTSNNVGTDDLRRLGARTARNSSNPNGPTLGPSSLFSTGRTNSGRRGLGPGSMFSRGEDSGTSSRTGTPPQREKDKKEDGDKSNTNAFR